MLKITAQTSSTTVPNRVSGWLLANGTLTPQKIGFQGTNMILNATAITLDSSETHLFYMQYYPITETPWSGKDCKQ